MPRECASTTFTVAEVLVRAAGSGKSGETRRWSARSRRGTYPQIESTLDRRRVPAVITVDEPPHHAISQLVGSSIADASRCCIDDRAFERDDHHFRRSALGLRVPNIVQNCVAQVIIVTGWLGKRHREQLAKIVPATRGELHMRFGGSAHWSTYSLDRGGDEAAAQQRRSYNSKNPSRFPTDSIALEPNNLPFCCTSQGTSVTER